MTATLSGVKKQRLLDALARGISIADAASLVGARRKFVRRLLALPEYQAAVRLEAKDIRAREEPTKMAAAIAIRDDPAASGEDRLKAIDFLMGKRRGRRRAAVEPPTRDSPGSSGYVIARQADGGIAGAFIASPGKASKIIPASDRQNAGDVEADVGAERREARTVRMTRG